MNMKRRILLVLAGGVLSLYSGREMARADDFKDNIAEVTDDAVAPEDNLPQKTVNLRYIIADAIGQAKKGKKEADKVQTNINDGTSDNTQNSIVVEAGSRVDKVINIVTEK